MRNSPDSFLLAGGRVLGGIQVDNQPLSVVCLRRSGFKEKITCAKLTQEV
jgi:hypothetical protein